MPQQAGMQQTIMNTCKCAGMLPMLKSRSEYNYYLDLQSCQQAVLFR